MTNIGDMWMRQLFNNDNVGKEFFVKLEAQDAAGSAVIRFRL